MVGRIHKIDHSLMVAGQLYLSAYIARIEDLVSAINPGFFADIPLTLYPNPAKDAFTLKSFNTGILTLTDIQGKEVQRENIVFGSNYVDISHLPSGTYFYKFVGERQVQSGKVVKE